MESIFSKRIKAGKRRTYFFDVRETRSSDFFITITESKKRFNDDGYDRHKMFIYKEDFNKFLAALTETVDYVKTELMPDFDFDSFNHDEEENQGGNTYHNNASNEETATVSEPTVNAQEAEQPVVKESAISSTADDVNVDDWKI